MICVSCPGVLAGVRKPLAFWFCTESRSLHVAEFLQTALSYLIRDIKKEKKYNVAMFLAAAVNCMHIKFNIAMVRNSVVTLNFIVATVFSSLQR